MIIPSIGATCLGMVMGWLVIYSLRRIEQITVATLGGVVTVVLGSAVTKFLEISQEALSFYPIGLVLGFAIYILTLPARIRYASQYENPQQQSGPDAQVLNRISACEAKISAIMAMLPDCFITPSGRFSAPGTDTASPRPEATPAVTTAEDDSVQEP